VILGEAAVPLLSVRPRLVQAAMPLGTSSAYMATPRPLRGDVLRAPGPAAISESQPGDQKRVKSQQAPSPGHHRYGQDGHQGVTAAVPSTIASAQRGPAARAAAFEPIPCILPGTETPGAGQGQLRSDVLHRVSGNSKDWVRKGSSRLNACRGRSSQRRCRGAQGPGRLPRGGRALSQPRAPPRPRSLSSQMVLREPSAALIRLFCC